MKLHSELIDFEKAAKQLFLSCQNPMQLRKLILDLPHYEELFSYSAHYDRVDKLVLWNSDDKNMQIRLHVYSNRLCDNVNQIDITKAHNHRWNFSTRILFGGYSHTIYRRDLLPKGKYNLNPVMIRHEGVGSSYTLHHSQYHSILEEPNTVSLIVRGPLEKGHFQVVTEENGEIHLKDASNLQIPKEKCKKIMSLAAYKKVVRHLYSLKII